MINSGRGKKSVLTAKGVHRRPCPQRDPGGELRRLPGFWKRSPGRRPEGERESPRTAAAAASAPARPPFPSGSRGVSTPRPREAAARRCRRRRRRPRRRGPRAGRAGAAQVRPCDSAAPFPGSAAAAAPRERRCPASRSPRVAAGASPEQVGPARREAAPLLPAAAGCGTHPGAGRDGTGTGGAFLTDASRSPGA